MIKRSAAFLSSRKAHVLLLVLGTAFLLTGAFHGNVWFDESYSVAIATHSFSDIWSIGANDVHPILFYWALHALSLITGQNILVYRLFTVAGAVALALLGYTHLRRDFGWKLGFTFSFLSLFTPYIADMAIQIRMYSWATFTVMLCAIYAYRIYLNVKCKPAQESDAAGQKYHASIPIHWWIVFFASSLASAYLHYFGTLSAFAINLLLLIALLRHASKHKKALGIFAVGAVLQIALFLPWLFALESQLSVISNTYWLYFVFPTSLIELTTYPVYTSQIAFALRGAYGLPMQVLVALAVLVLAFSIIALVMRSLRSRHSMISQRRKSGGQEQEKPCRSIPAWLAGLLFYFLVVGLAVLFSLLVSPMMYYRYLFIAIGPLLFACAYAISRSTSKRITACLCAGLLVLSMANQALLISDDYSYENTDPLEYFEQKVEPGELVLSSDIGIEGVTSVTYPDIPQTYLDWQPGNWGAAYEAYAPTLTSVKSWNQALDGYSGKFIVLGTSSDGSMPRDITDIQNSFGAQIVDMQTFYRPYERTYFTIATLTK